MPAPFIFSTGRSRGWDGNARNLRSASQTFHIKSAATFSSQTSATLTCAKLLILFPDDLDGPLISLFPVDDDAINFLLPNAAPKKQVIYFIYRQPAVDNKADFRMRFSEVNKDNPLSL